MSGRRHRLDKDYMSEYSENETDSDSGSYSYKKSKKNKSKKHGKRHNRRHGGESMGYPYPAPMQSMQGQQAMMDPSMMGMGMPNMQGMGGMGMPNMQGMGAMGAMGGMGAMGAMGGMGNMGVPMAPASRADIQRDAPVGFLNPAESQFVSNVSGMPVGGNMGPMPSSVSSALLNQMGGSRDTTQEDVYRAKYHKYKMLYNQLKAQLQ